MKNAVIKSLLDIKHKKICIYLVHNTLLIIELTLTLKKSSF